MGQQRTDVALKYQTLYRGLLTVASALVAAYPNEREAVYAELKTLFPGLWTILASHKEMVDANVAVAEAAAIAQQPFAWRLNDTVRTGTKSDFERERDAWFSRLVGAT